jgi:hypothetical protein
MIIKMSGHNNTTHQKNKRRVRPPRCSCVCDLDQKSDASKQRDSTTVTKRITRATNKRNIEPKSKMKNGAVAEQSTEKTKRKKATPEQQIKARDEQTVVKHTNLRNKSKTGDPIENTVISRNSGDLKKNHRKQTDVNIEKTVNKLSRTRTSTRTNTKDSKNNSNVQLQFNNKSPLLSSQMKKGPVIELSIERQKTKKKTTGEIQRKSRDEQNVGKNENLITVNSGEFKESQKKQQLGGNREERMKKESKTRTPAVRISSSSLTSTRDLRKNGNVQVQTNIKSPSPILKLRKRKFVNYAENSLEITKNNEKSDNTKKIPIYKQQIDDNIKNNNIGDQYEFDSDSEKQKNRKRRKLDDSSSDEYNKTIQNILKNIRNKTRRRDKKVAFSERNKNLEEFKQIPLEKNKSNKIKTQSVVITQGKDKDNKKNKENIVYEERRNLNGCIEIPQKKPQEEHVEYDQQNDDVGQLDDNEYFGFDENTKSSKIISNIQLQQNSELNVSVATATFFKRTRPNANSTMLQNGLTPWRFSEMNVKRNPHFLTLKESSLPCINQDMVLDHSIVDQFENSFKTETKRSTVKKAKMSTPTRATVITDYFESDVENKENSQVSLFDADQLSPIKSRSKLNSKVDSVKRRILGEKDSNVVSSTPNRSLRESRNLRQSRLPGLSSPNKPKETANNFGFDSSVDESVERSSPKKNPQDKPFRLSISVNDKKYDRKRKFRRIEKAESIVDSGEDDLSDESNVESQNNQNRLFEDLDATEENIVKEVPIKKKKLKWLDQNPSKEHHKKRKDVRSKEEEEEAEKWAAAFNSMCEEIQEFPLEIE